jgi:hypothetical protein
MKIILILIYIYLEDFYDGNTHFVNISILYGRHNLGPAHDVGNQGPVAILNENS